MAERYGKWPGVVSIVGDAELWCVPCVRLLYGEEPVQAVIDGTTGYEQYTDHEGNALGVVLHGSEDVHGMSCGKCSARLCDEECSCYQVDWDAVDGEVNGLAETCLLCFQATTGTCFQCGLPLCSEC